MAIPKGFKEVTEGTCQHGDYIVDNVGRYEDYAFGLVGSDLPNPQWKCYRLEEIAVDQSDKTEYQIIFDALMKHNLHIHLCHDLVGLVRYARQIGFNEGFKEAKKEMNK